MTFRMRAARGLTIAIAAATIAHGCTHPELPMAPSVLTEGIILYEHANFLGNSAHITSDIPNLGKFKGPCVHDNGDSVDRDWNDCVSSVRVAPGWIAGERGKVWRTLPSP